MTVRSSTISMLAALVVALGAAPALADANLLANGSFEGGFTNTCGGVTCSAVPNSWQLIDYNIDGISSPAFGTYEGTKAVDMNGDRPGAIAQTFATEAGAEYAVTFALAGNHTCGGGTMTLQVSAAGTSTQFTYATGTSFGPYQAKTFGFTATGSSTTIEFRSLTLVGSSGGAAQCGPVVDDVRVSEVITPVRATFNDDVAPIITAYNPPERLIDGSGLHGVGPILSQTAEGGWWGPNNEGNGEDGANFKAPGGNVLWYGVQPIAEWPPLEFDLGGTAELTGLHIWNYAHFRYAFFRDRDTRDIDVYLSSDGVNYTFAGRITLQAGNVFVAQNEFGQRGNIESVQSFPLTGTASHVRLKVRSNYGNSSETGLSEVRFSGILTPVVVVDTTPPVVILNGAAEITLECHIGAYVEAGATATDDRDGAVPVTITGSVDADTPGDYTVTYSATDAAGNTASAARTVHVVDTTPPVVSLNGSATVTIECHIGAYSEEGASAFDLCDGALAVTTSGTVDVNTLGTYEVTYTATDASGHSASASRTVKVVDTTPPTLTLNGANPLQLTRPTTYTEPGATISDACDEHPSLAISGTVDANIPGTYTVTYIATDHRGNQTIKTRTVEVLNREPVCALAAPSIAQIWPPNHKMVDISILNVTDPDGDPVTLTITGITQDEPVNTAGDGNTDPDGAGVGTSVAQVRAERAGSKKVPGNGRVYVISFTAADNFGASCPGKVAVCVPHDQGKGSCIDDGQKYNSVSGGLAGPAAKLAASAEEGGIGVGNYPNPFNPATTIVYNLSQASAVRLAVYNALGQQVRVLVEEVQRAGGYAVEWNGLDEAGQPVAGGLYFYQLQAGAQQATGRMLFLK